jgi:MFS family permease
MSNQPTKNELPKTTESKKERKRTILSVGFASFFGGISQDIFIPIFPLYLTQILGFDKAIVGIAEGLVSAAASGFKVIAGRLSDKYRRQKPIVIAGYTLSMIGRGLLAFASIPLAVFGLRFVDGVGKGIKDPPKDVLVANAADEETRGRSFGIARMLDTFGSAIGPLILSGLIVVFTRHHTAPSHYYRWLMILSALVLIATITVVKVGIHEVKNPKVEHINTKAPLAKSFYLFTAIAGVFAIANSSDAFLILRSQNLGLSIVAIPLAYALLNIVYGSLSLPAGILSDKVGRIPMITVGWAVYGFSYLGFAFAHSSWQVWPLFAFYGVFYAASEGVGRALIADVVGSEARGRAYGVYNMVIGLAALPAGLIAGLMWDHISPSAPFYFSAVVSLFAVLLLLGFRTQLKPVGSRSQIQHA